MQVGKSNGVNQHEGALRRNISIGISAMIYINIQITIPSAYVIKTVSIVVSGNPRLLENPTQVAQPDISTVIRKLCSSERVKIDLFFKSPALIAFLASIICGGLGSTIESVSSLVIALGF
jgi:hypothetical protein